MRIDVKIVKDEDAYSMTEVFECLYCGGHTQFDNSFIDQVEPFVTCPYCKKVLEIPELI